MKSKHTTMTDIARAVGVSQSAVSMVLSGKSSSFPPSTVEKILSTAAAMNYRVKNTLQQKTSSNVMVISAQATNPYYTNMIQGIERAAVSNEINILAAFTYHDPMKEAVFLRMAVEQHWLGVIFLYAPENDAAYRSAKDILPIITVCDKASNFPGDIIELNNFSAGALAAEHLLSLGHKKIAVLSHRGNDKGTSSRETRLAGIMSKIKGINQESDLLVLVSNNSSTGYLDENSFHYHVGYSLAQNKKIYTNGITGIICVNDLIAYGVIDAILDKGLRVPEDFSVIGSDNLLYSGMKRVSLSTIEHYSNAIANSAFTSLLMRVQSTLPMQNKAMRLQMQYQPTLVVRDSTAPARTHELELN